MCPDQTLDHSSIEVRRLAIRLRDALVVFGQTRLALEGRQRREVEDSYRQASGIWRQLFGGIGYVCPDILLGQGPLPTSDNVCYVASKV